MLNNTHKKTPRAIKAEGVFLKFWQRLTFPPGMAVSSALAGLTSLFGMGRGGPCRNSHPKIFQVKSVELKVKSIINILCLLSYNFFPCYDINMGESTIFDG